MPIPENLVKLSQVRSEFDAGSKLSDYRGIVAGVPTELVKLSDLRGRISDPCAAKEFIEINFNDTSYGNFSDWVGITEADAVTFWENILGYDKLAMRGGTVGDPQLSTGWVLDSNSNFLRFTENTTIPKASNQGAVYVYDWNGSAWVERTTALTASDAGASDFFGDSCALSSDGSTMAVGAPFWDGGAGSNQGAVYVYDWNGSAWVERTMALTASDAGGSDFFGESCALSSDGSTLAVGAAGWDGAGGTSQGAVYIYDWNGSAWVERASVVTASDAGASDFFGYSCALSSDGSIMAVGAISWDGAGGTGQGAVYVYDWNGSAWVERTTALTPSDAGAIDNFSYSCALSSDGSTMAVGAPFWDGAAVSNQGAVYIYDWNGSAWVERTTALTASDAGAGDYLGYSCALSSDGTVLAVGASFWDGAGSSNQGAVYVYDWNGSAWVERTMALTASDAGGSDFFGESCALSSDGTVLTVGAPTWDGDSESLTIIPSVAKYYPGTQFTWNASCVAPNNMYLEFGFLTAFLTVDDTVVFDYSYAANSYDGTSETPGLYETGDLTVTVPFEEQGYAVLYVVPFIGAFESTLAAAQFAEMRNFEVKNVIRDETCPSLLPAVPDPFAANVKFSINAENGFSGTGSFDYPLPSKGPSSAMGVDGFAFTNNDTQNWTRPDRFITTEFSKFGTSSLNWNIIFDQDSELGPIEYPDNFEYVWDVDSGGLDTSNYVNNNTPGTAAYYESHFMPVIGTGDFTLEGWVRADYQLQKYTDVAGYNTLPTDGEKNNIDARVSGRATLFGLGSYLLDYGNFTDPNSPYDSDVLGVGGALVVTADNELYWAKIIHDTGSLEFNDVYIDCRERVSFGTHTLRDGNWHFVSLSRNSGVVRCHVDGVYVGQGVDNRYITGRRQFSNSTNASAYTTPTIGILPGNGSREYLLGDHRAPLETNQKLDVENRSAFGSFIAFASWQGQIDDFRYTAGIGRYGTDDNYTLPGEGFLYGAVIDFDTY